MNDAKKSINWSDVLDWDIKNWSRAVQYWFKNTRKDFTKSLALEIGANNGGLSLTLALHDARVVCSDLNGPSEKAREMHN